MELAKKSLVEQDLDSEQFPSTVDNKGLKDDPTTESCSDFVSLVAMLLPDKEKTKLQENLKREKGPEEIKSVAFGTVREQGIVHRAMEAIQSKEERDGFCTKLAGVMKLMPKHSR